MPQRGQQVSLSHSESAVEIDPSPACGGGSTEPAAFRARRTQPLGERLGRRQRGGLTWFGRIRPIRRESDVGKARRWNEIGDQPVRSHLWLAVRETLWHIFGH